MYIQQATFYKAFSVTRRNSKYRTETLPSARKTKQIFYIYYILDEARIREKREKDTEERLSGGAVAEGAEETGSRSEGPHN